MQVVENWAVLVGEVVSRRAGPQQDTEVVTLRVTEARDSNPWPNLLSHHVGRSVAVRVPGQLAAQLSPGRRVHVRARLAGPGVVVSGVDRDDVRACD